MLLGITIIKSRNFLATFIFALFSLKTASAKIKMHDIFFWCLGLCKESQNCDIKTSKTVQNLQSAKNSMFTVTKKLDKSKNFIRYSNHIESH